MTDAVHDLRTGRMALMPHASRVQQVEAACRALILAGRPGDRLPGEKELAATLATSRVTVREALSRLWHRGLVVRRWGVGTFIAATDRFTSARGVYVGLDPVGSLPQRLAALGQSVTLSHFAVGHGSWPDWIAPMDSDTPWRIERCMTIDGEPALLIIDYLPLMINGAPVPDPRSLGDIGNDLPNMMRSAGVRIVKDEATLHGCAVTTAQAAPLGLEPGTPVLHSRQRSLSEAGTIVACAETYYHPENFTSTLVRTVAE